MSAPEDTRSRQRSEGLSSQDNNGVGKLEMRKEEIQPLKVSLRLTCPKCGVTSIGGLKIRAGHPEGSTALSILYGVTFVALGSWMIYSLIKES